MYTIIETRHLGGLVQTFRMSSDPLGARWVTIAGRAVCASIEKDRAWIRVFGFGLAVEHDMPVSFSEREGLRVVLRVGRWSLEVLSGRAY